MARFLKTVPQEATLIRGSIIENTQDYYWIIDDAGNRVAVTWRQDYADRIADALDVIEDIEEQERIWEARGKP